MENKQEGSPDPQNNPGAQQNNINFESVYGGSKMSYQTISRGKTPEQQKRDSVQMHRPLSKNSMGSPQRLDKFDKEPGIIYSGLKDGSKVYESFSENPYDKSDPGPSQESTNQHQFGKNKLKIQSDLKSNYNISKTTDANTMKRGNDKKQMQRHERFDTYDDMFKRKIRAIYGTRASLKLANEVLPLRKKSIKPALGSEKKEVEDTVEQEKFIWYQKLIISPDSQWKSIFDMIVLIFVGYSCIWNVMYFAFDSIDDTSEKFAKFNIFNKVSEGIFYTDFIFSFFQAFRHKETFEIIADLKSIASNYIKGWFMVDLVSIFPFQLLLRDPSQAQNLKLARLARMPRLAKLLEESRFKSILKALDKDQGDDKKIMSQYQTLYYYNMVKLIIIAVIATYFLGCFWFVMSSRQQDVFSIFIKEEEDTWYKYFEIDKMAWSEQLITSCYFALTTLSTVGYGDLYPKSQIEMAVSVIVMLLGVAFFSFIMGNFVTISDKQSRKMGQVDKKGDLNDFLISVQRFKNRQPVQKSLQMAIEKNFLYFWANDRIQIFKNQSKDQNLLPTTIKEDLISQYLFKDLFKAFHRFFEDESIKNKELLSDISYGFLPRNFTATEDDRIIYDENQEISELYFILEGFIGIGFSLVNTGYTNKSLILSKKQEGIQLICDHYVINKRNSNFLYMALDDCKCYALTRKFLHNEFFPKHKDFEIRVKSSVYRFYRKWIYKPINEHREKETQMQNRKTRLYRQVKVRNNVKINIPSVQAYRNHMLLEQAQNNYDFDNNAQENEEQSDIGDEKENQIQFHKDLLGSQQNATDNNMLDALDQLGQTTKHMSKEVKTLFEVTDQQITNTIKQIEKSNII